MVAAVPGSKTVEVVVPVTQDFSTRGTRAYRPAKQSISGKTLFNKKALTLLMVLTR